MYNNTEGHMDIVSPAALTGAQEFEHIAVDAQTIPQGRAAGVAVFRVADDGFDPVAQNIRDATATTTLDTGYAPTAYSMDAGWWQVRSTDEVERLLSRYPDVLVDAVREEVVDALHTAHTTWQRAVLANGSPEAARAEGYESPQKDRAARHARAVLQVVDTEREARR
jgi:hypothetical protein